MGAVFTDPPYFGNVQYAELMDFCYVWLKKLVGRDLSAFSVDSTRTLDELTGNVDMGRGLDHFTQGLSSVFQHMAKALKPGSPLAFTYHHNNLEAYYPIAVAILDAGLTCSASLPCPAEMGASIIDTVFVCRRTGTMQRKWLADSPDEVARIVEKDLDLLRAGNVKPTPGDIRCITYGHLVRLAIWALRIEWNKREPIITRMAKVKDWLQHFGSLTEIENALWNTQSPPAVDDRHLLVESPEIIQISEAENAARQKENDTGQPFAHVKPVDAEESQESEENPSDGVIQFPIPISEIRLAVHGGDQKKIDDPADQEKPESKKPDGS